MTSLDLPQGVQLETDSHGLQRLVIDTPAARGCMYLHGAHVTHWQPADHQPVIWMSEHGWFEPGKPIRGGVPICFPWFGPRKDDADAPAHGFARLKNWMPQTVERGGDDAVVVTMTLQEDDDTRALWPHHFAAAMRVTFGRSLTMELTVENRGGAAMSFEQALHTYFAVGDVRQISIAGLTGVPFADRVPPGADMPAEDKPITVAAETDRTYFDTAAACVLTDPSMGRAITVAKRGSQTTVVWNPWVNKSRAMPDFGDDEWPSMMCIETANAGDNAITLAAGSSHTMSAIIEVEKV